MEAIPEAVLLDANVYVSAWTLDVLLSLADAALFDPLWSDEIVAEARSALKKLRPGRDKAIDAYLKAAMEAYPYGRVAAADAAAANVRLPDPDDRHVVAAAIAGEAQVIVTYNVKDFPEGALAPFGLTACTPDDFLCSLAERHGSMVVDVVRSLTEDKKRPPRTLEEEIAGLRRNNLGCFADFLQANMQSG